MYVWCVLFMSVFNVFGRFFMVFMVIFLLFVVVLVIEILFNVFLVLFFFFESCVMMCIVVLCWYSVVVSFFCVCVSCFLRLYVLRVKVFYLFWKVVRRVGMDVRVGGCG